MATTYGDRTAYVDTNRYYSNVRGVYITGDLGDRKISFQTMVQEHQAIVPQYLFLQVAGQGVISGQGRVKLKSARILDYGWSQGQRIVQGGELAERSTSGKGGSS
jgi:hypothetical protein